MSTAKTGVSSAYLEENSQFAIRVNQWVWARLGSESPGCCNISPPLITNNLQVIWSAKGNLSSASVKLADRSSVSWVPAWKHADVSLLEHVEILLTIRVTVVLEMLHNVKKKKKSNFKEGVSYRTGHSVFLLCQPMTTWKPTIIWSRCYLCINNPIELTAETFNTTDSHCCTGWRVPLSQSAPI